ncbi:MurR/RpiR family transcriptional regulator [Pseudorhodobacter sp.]|uniref:MurR/RpiR family transcriptional regulator n=1 Tax=Pseudorhodobacter sp. TaxID=1934400 RepID=UPI0039E6A1B2
MLHRKFLKDQIVRDFDAMSPQLQQAARYVLENPQDVALMSMRRLARNAGLQPATMTRLAKFLGLKGYDDIRAHYAAAIRTHADGFAARAMGQQTGNPGGQSEAASHSEAGVLAYEMLQSRAAQIARLSEARSLASLQAAADHLGRARRIYVLGMRSCHSVAWHFHYVMTLLGEKTEHLDGPAGTGADGLLRAREGDVLLVISINPYTQYSLELAAMAREKAMTVIAITDSEVSPFVAISEVAILCATESQSFFHTLAPALAVSEVLCGLLAASDRQAALEALQRADRHLDALHIYSNTMPQRRV